MFALYLTPAARQASAIAQFVAGLPRLPSRLPLRYQGEIELRKAMAQVCVVLATVDELAAIPDSADADCLAIPVTPNEATPSLKLARPWIGELLAAKASRPRIEYVLRRAAHQIELGASLVRMREELALKSKHIGILHELGAKLTSEPKLENLLELILTTGREIMRADAGSLYLIEKNPETGVRELAFLVSQNDSVEVPFKAFRMPLSLGSLAGYVAVTGNQLTLDDVYRISPEEPYKFNNSFDQKVGYRTKSMLVLPLRTHENDVIGVLQLINKKAATSYRFHNTADFEANALPFDAEDATLGLALGSQAAIAVENARLYGEIEHLLQSFMQASVKAIEARDPTTSGHSERVAEYSVELAKAIDRVDRGALASFRFNRTELEALYYAGILHDFGKIGVREDVLIKAKKLYPHQMQAVSDRFHYLRRVLELRAERAKVARLIADRHGDPAHLFADIEGQLTQEIARLDAAYKVILDANEPSILAQTAAETLHGLVGLSIEDIDGMAIPLLSGDEYSNLSIAKGSLNERERLEIESHVTHTFNFLRMIPWTRDLRSVPEIAYGHHEKLDGTGYPRHLTADEIPLQVRMMTTADIFDALTAQDRPYKRAVPVERALAILEMEVKEGKLDAEVVHTFIESKVYEPILARATARA